MAARRRPPLTSPKEQPPPHAAVNQALTTVTLENQDHEAQILHVVPPLARRAGHWDAWITATRRPPLRLQMIHGCARACMSA